MDHTTDGLEGMFAYMDDSRVGSPDRHTHLHHLEAFFKALAANGLAINFEKCVFATPSLEILGHMILATGVAPTADHAAEIKIAHPSGYQAITRFLGMVNFYRRFLPKCAQILEPLTDLLKGGTKTLEWTVSVQEAFQNAKRLLVAVVPLQHPAPNAELSLATDASDTHIGGVMQQKSGDRWRPLGFFSHKLTDTESRYSTFDRELLAAHAAIKHFRHFCEGRAFQRWTDHKPLVTAISCVSAPISPRQQRHLAFISEFNVQILYLPGLKNVVADFLSRPNQTITGSVAATSAAVPMDFEEMAAEQNRCPETQHLLGGTSLKLSFRQIGAQRLAEDISTGTFRPIVPLKFRKNIFDHFHNVAHPGGILPPIVLFHLNLCGGVFPATSPPGPACAWSASGARSTATHAWFPLPIPQWRFSHPHVDLVGPLQYSNNYNYIFTIIDRMSKWMEAIPLSETSAAACTKALTFTWISHFGVPETITSDHGPQFTSNLWFQLCEILNISHKTNYSLSP